MSMGAQICPSKAMWSMTNLKGTHVKVIRQGNYSLQ